MTKGFDLLKAKARGFEVRAIERLLMESTTCESWMTPRPHTVTPSDSVGVARKLLRLHRINQLPVVGSHSKKLLGIITDRDLRDATRGVCTDLSVESLMSHPAISLVCHSTMLNAAEVMRVCRIGSVPIVDGESVVGIVTRSDILEALVAFANGRYRRASGAKMAALKGVGQEEAVALRKADPGQGSQICTTSRPRTGCPAQGN